jgi:hypothetical protein
VAKRQMQVGRHALIVATDLLARRLQPHLKELSMNQNMVIIMAAVRAASLEVIREGIAGERASWEISFLELLIVKSGDTE